MRIAVAHNTFGRTLATSIKSLLRELGHQILDFGESSTQIDYVDLAFFAGQAIHADLADRAILICTSGFATSIVANKIKGLYAAPCYDQFDAHVSRSRFDTNVLCLSDRWTDPQDAHKIVSEWLKTPFEKRPSDLRSINKIKEFEAQRLSSLLSSVKSDQSRTG
jgi:ribose 5-phosphate isomerase B